MSVRTFWLAVALLVGAQGCSPAPSHSESAEPSSSSNPAESPTPDGTPCPRCATDPTATVTPPTDLTFDEFAIPDAMLTDQDGKQVRFADLVAGKVVAVNFLFTTCTTSCPVLGTNFGELRRQLGDQLGKEFALISVSVDPQVDTPERLKAWSAKFGGGPGWSLLTGPKDGVDRLLRGLGVYTPDKTSHPSTILVIDGVNGRVLRTSGLAAPADLLRVLKGARTAPVKPAPKSAARNYFTDTPLVTQDGREVRFYSDLIAGKVVVINVFFTSCTGSCLVMSKTLGDIQSQLGDHLGKDARILSITVDPENDTPARLKAYAEQFAAKPGWVFLTGEKRNVDFILAKLGQSVANKEAHSSIMIIGNDRTGLWKKGFGLAGPEKLTELVGTVLHDHPAE